MSNIITERAATSPIITDGAWGTQFQTIGLQPGECPDLWNLIYPERVKAVASAYVNAGSEIILTNTFHANRFTLQSYGLEGKLKDINRMGVLISRKAASERALVFGSIGPCAKPFMENKINPNELLSVYTEQAEILAAGGADAIIVETMVNLQEAKIALSAAKKTGLPVVVSILFNLIKDISLTLAGESPERIAQELTDAGADAIGANCGYGIENCISVSNRFRSATDLPIWMKPSAGIPKIIRGELVYPTSVKNFSEYAVALSKLGVAYIGGCCGTSPEYIRALRQVLKPKRRWR